MADPIPTYKALIERINKKYPDLAYIHVVEPIEGRVASAPGIERSNKFIDDTRLPEPVIHAAEFNADTARAATEKDGVLVGFGRMFISNPDLPVRLQTGIPLARPDHTKLFTHGAEGYTDYPSADE